MKKLLIVEDNADLRENMRWALKPYYIISEAETVEQCIEVFTSIRPDVVCLDMGLNNIPDGGLALIDKLILTDRHSKIIVITANTSSAIGPDSVKRGAYDFFNKPIDIEELRRTIDRALRIRSFELLAGEASSSELRSLLSDNGFMLIGQSNAMLRVFDFIQKLSQTDVNVLITGESGTGKELCARAVHYHSNRRANNFVPINCGAIPENLIESELFGYEKGAFTGATADKEGLIESAEGGTLLLDEIGEMPKNMQVKLLRFLEDQQVQRVGGTTFKKVNVRIIAATNRKNLDSESSALREDLYYRLSEFQIDIPALRERGDDVILISNHLIEKYRIKFNKARLQLSPRSEMVLKGYSWPGNVRELENKLSRASITCINDCIEPEDLQLNTKKQFSSLNYKDARDMFDKEFLSALLQVCGDNISEAAKISGVSRPTLYAMMKKLDLDH